MFWNWNQIADSIFYKDYLYAKCTLYVERGIHGTVITISGNWYEDIKEATATLTGSAAQLTSSWQTNTDPAILMSRPVYMHVSIATPELPTNHCPGNGLNNLHIVEHPDVHIIFPSSCSSQIHLYAKFNTCEQHSSTSTMYNRTSTWCCKQDATWLDGKPHLLKQAYLLPPPRFMCKHSLARKSQGTVSTCWTVRCSRN